MILQAHPDNCSSPNVPSCFHSTLFSSSSCLLIKPFPQSALMNIVHLPWKLTSSIIFSTSFLWSSSFPSQINCPLLWDVLLYCIWHLMDLMCMQLFPLLHCKYLQDRDYLHWFFISRTKKSTFNNCAQWMLFECIAYTVSRDVIFKRSIVVLAFWFSMYQIISLSYQKRKKVNLEEHPGKKTQSNWMWYYLIG